MSADHTKPSPGRRRGILLVDDHPLTRYGVKLRISAEPDLEVCGECDAAAAAAAAVRNRVPDLVLLDLSFGDRNGLELLKDLNASHPRLPVLVFSMYPESLYAERVLRAGARGYLMKSEGAEKLIEAIRKVLRGDVYLSPLMLERLAARFADRPQASGPDAFAQLSDRELEVFELIGGGLRTREIARKLGVSVSTVETHRAHLKQKLDVASTGQLIRAAVEWQAGRQRSPA
jgi:DNA-binding NarL/FixJ family response regulator